MSLVGSGVPSRTPGIEGGGVVDLTSEMLDFTELSVELKVR